MVPAPNSGLIDGYKERLAVIAPNVLAIIPRKIINKRTVQVTLDIWCWVGDIEGPLCQVEYLTYKKFQKHSPSIGCSGLAYLESN